MNKKEKGSHGESIAQTYLLENGYEIVDTNVQLGQLEIDIIAQLNNLLVFVEVRLRHDNRYGFPEEGLSKTKIRAIQRAAEFYIQKIGWQEDIRIDLIAILEKPELSLEHFQDIC